MIKIKAYEVTSIELSTYYVCNKKIWLEKQQGYFTTWSSQKNFPPSQQDERIDQKL